MAIKNLNMMNLVCERDNLNNLIKDLILKENCQFVNSYLEIENNDFAIGMTEENADEILNLENNEPIKSNREIKEYIDKLDSLSEKLEYTPVRSKKYIEDNISSIYA